MRVTVHTVLTKQEAVSLCLLEIVTHRRIWTIFQCVMDIMRLVWYKAFSFKHFTVIIIGVYRPPDKSKIPPFAIKLKFVMKFSV